MKDHWEGMDPDDIQGYLLDYLAGKMTDSSNRVISESTLKILTNTKPGQGWAFEVLNNIRQAVEAYEHSNN